MKKFNGFNVIENRASTEQVYDNTCYRCGDEYRFCVSVNNEKDKAIKAFGLTEEQKGDLNYYRTLAIEHNGSRVRFFNDIWMTAVDDESVMTGMPFEEMSEKYRFLFCGAK